MKACKKTNFMYWYVADVGYDYPSSKSFGYLSLYRKTRHRYTSCLETNALSRIVPIQRGIA